MDPLTHFFTGAAISRSGLNRKTALATLTLVLAAEAPDIDIVTSIAGPFEGFSHRGITHTFFSVPFISAAVLGLVYAIHRWQESRRAQERSRVAAKANPDIDDHIPIEVKRQPVRWGLLYIYAVIASLSHILLDFTNSYGVRPFGPFNWRWYGWDIVFIFEPMVTAPLLLALIAPWFLGLIGGEVGAKRQQFPGRSSAIAALVIMTLVWWVRDYNHRKAVTLLQAEVYSGEEPKRVMAGPYTINPFKWLGVVETSKFFQTMDVDTLKGEVDPEHRAAIRYKPEETKFSLAAKKSPIGRVYLDWARFPYTEVELVDEKEGGGALVHLRDLRFAYPDSSSKLLSVTVELDRNAHVVGWTMGDREEKCKKGCD